MNLNFYNSPEYDLNRSLITEMISMYGVQVKFVKVKKINEDALFKDYQHLVADKKDIIEMYALPENSESFDTSAYQFNAFGFTDFNNLSVYISVESFGEIKFKEIIGNLIVLPSNKILEITDVTFQVPGINNDFVNNNSRTVYKLTLTPYEFKLTDKLSDIQETDEEISPLDFSPKSLDNYFDELMKEKEDLEIELEVKDSQTVSRETNLVDDFERPIDEKIKSQRNVTTDDVWGSFS